MGYPSLEQVLGTPVLRRTTLSALAVSLAVLAVLALRSGLSARRAAHRRGAPEIASAAALCGVAVGSAILVAEVAGFEKLGVTTASTAFDVVLLLAATLIAAVLGTAAGVGAAAAGRGAGRRWVPLGVAALALAAWALLISRLIAATEARGLPLVPPLIAAGAFVLGWLGLSQRLSGGRRIAAVVAALGLIAAGTLPAVALRPPHRPPPPAPGAAAAGTLADPPPHVVIVLIDTWRWDATDLAAPDLGTTPALTALASRGSTVFSHTSAAASSTLPSVKALFTGRPASQYGIPWAASRPPPPEAWTLGRAFHARGYDAAAFTANALIQGDGFETGFGDFWAVGGLNNLRRSFFLYGLLARGDYWRVVALADALRVHKTGGDSVVDRFEAWLDRRPGRAPRFAYVHLIEPHFPYQNHGRGLVPEAVRNLPETYSHADFGRLPLHDPANRRFRGTPGLEEMIGRYHEEVREADRLLARITAALAKRGLLDDTLLVVTGDHGEEFFEHDSFGHGHDVYEELVHVPLVVDWPKRPAFSSMPEEVATPVSLLDVFPTLTEMLDLPPTPEPFVGRSLVPLLSRGEEDGGMETAAEDALVRGGSPVISEAVLRGQAYLSYRLGSWKARFVLDERRLPSEAGEAAVFDLAADPGETSPLDPAAPEASELLARARRDLDALWGHAREVTVRALTPSTGEESTGEKDEALERLRALGYLN
jgi:arylsulfatase A-like enzyme